MMKLFINLALLSGVVTSSVLLRQRSLLDVHLKSVGNTAVVATVKNNGSKNLRLLSEGTLFDTAPVQKLSVKGAGMCF
jgi:Deuterolysin metalloprotease (M35) family